VDAALVEQGCRGLLHLLGYVGLLHGALVPAAPPTTARLMQIDRKLHYVCVMDDGVHEPLVGLGAVVRKGEPAARVHFPAHSRREPETVNFAGDGEVICKRAIAMVKRGDCIFQLASERRARV
jgi:predicted deacylase